MQYLHLGGYDALRFFRKSELDKRRSNAYIGKRVRNLKLRKSGGVFLLTVARICT